MKRRQPSPTPVNDALLEKWPLPKLPSDADKAARGDVLVMGGSAEIAGAVLLSGLAALRAGAGRVRLATARSAAASLAVAFPEARVIGLTQTADGEIGRTAAKGLKRDLGAGGAVLVGPGMRAHAAAEYFVQLLLREQTDSTLVLDAAALRLLCGRKSFPASSLTGVVVTPHAGEMAELWGCHRDEVQAEPLTLAREAARTLNVVVVLKGVETFIVTPDGRAFHNVAGNPGLATAGSGDVLSGVIAGLAARGAEPAQAAVWGVYLHAKAGEALTRKVGALGYLARELLGEVPRLLGRYSRV